MYIPNYFKETDLSAVKQFISENSFAVLVSEVNNRPWATHLPLMLDVNTDGQDALYGHVSRGNSQWKQFDQGKEVMAIFSGPHSYISSSWYDHENVPTWNYVAVHVYGKIEIITGKLLENHLEKLIDKYETNRTNRIHFSDLSRKLIDKEIKGIVGFEIKITEVLAASKLSQNRDAKNLDRIITGLENQNDHNSIEIAEIMKCRRPC